MAQGRQTAAVFFQSAVQDLRIILGDTAEGDLRRILQHRLGSFDPEQPLDDMMMNQLKDDIAGLKNHQPVSQIIGKRAFWHHDFIITPDVLDPRPDTETLVEQALDGAKARTVLDLGTGSGCILLSLLSHWQQTTGVGVDQSAKALAIAKQNAMRLGLENRVQWLKSDWFSNVSGQFDLIVSNPPYIAQTVWAGLEANVRDWEPKSALCSGQSGQEAYEIIFAQIKPYMFEHTRLLFEIGYDQGDALRDLALQNDLKIIKLHHDINDKPRVLELAGG